MRLRHLRLIHALAALVLAGTWAGVLAHRHLEGRASFLDRIEAPLADVRFALSGPRPAPRDMVIVALDDETVRDAGRYPIPRSIVAELIRRLRELGAAAIGLDILFVDPGQPAEDGALAAALKDTKSVIAAAATFGPAGNEGSGIPHAAGLLLPAATFRDATGIGIVNVATDAGGTPRHAPLLVNGPEGVLPSLALRVAAMAAGSGPVLSPDSARAGQVVSATDVGLSLPLRFYGPRGAIETLSASAILRGQARRDAVAGRTVLIGATALGTADTFATPFDPVLPGVEVLATATAHLLHGDGLVRDSRVRRIDAGVSVGLALLSAIGFVFLPASVALLSAVILVVLWLGATAAAFGAGYWLSAVLPLAAMTPGVLFGLLGRQWLDRLRTRQLSLSEDALRRFQAPALAERIARDPGYLAAPITRDVAVVFLDLNGFTGVSEQLGPVRTRDMLKEFHAVLSAAAEARSGVVMNFMGDGAMVLFGLPDAKPDDAERALLCSAELVDAIRGWLGERRTELGPNLGVRVGGHWGPVVLSRMGSAAQEQITATGDTVNVASRLLELGKQLGAALVVSEDLVRAAGSPASFTAALEGRRRVDIRGRRQPLEIAYR